MIIGGYRLMSRCWGSSNETPSNPIIGKVIIALRLYGHLTFVYYIIKRSNLLKSISDIPTNISYLYFKSTLVLGKKKTQNAV